MRIAYGKLGRSIPLTLEDASSVGGDIEVVRLLELLSWRHEVHLVGRNRANVSLPNVVNHWGPGSLFEDIPSMPYESMEPGNPVYQRFIEVLEQGTRRLPPMDAWVIWLGQHGTSCSFIPAVKAARNDTVRPLMSSINYAYPLVHMINALGARPIWLCPDPRNLLKLRDLWEPNQRPVLAQYNTYRDTNFYDARDGKLRNSRVKYVYSGIELLAVNPEEMDVAPNQDPPERLFGILVNEGPSNVKRNRRDLIKHWFKDLPEAEIIGHWTAESQKALGREIKPVPVTQVGETLRRWRSTITFPASNTGWATAKPHEAFAAGVICFKHPDYDDQGHIYGEHMPEELRSFLKVPVGPSALMRRLEALKDDNTWRHYKKLQWDYLQATRVRLEDGQRFVREAIEQVANEGTATRTA